MKSETREILLSSQEYLNRLAAGLANVIAALREGSGYRMDDFADMYEGMQWLSSALAGTADDHGIYFDMKKLENGLQEMLDAIDGDDSVLIADLLEYEIAPELQELCRKINIES